MYATRRSCLRLCGLLSVLCGLMAARAGWVEFNVGQVIPDYDETGMQDTQTLSGYGGAITSLEVRLQFSGDPLAYNGDFYATLQHAGGFSVLLNRTGRTSSDALGYGNNGFDVILNAVGEDIHLYQDESPAYDGEGRLTGEWGVDGRNVDPDDVVDTDARTALLSSFLGLDANGEWTIFVADVNLNGEASLDSWGLQVGVVPEPGTLVLLAVSGLLLFRYVRRKM